MRNYQNIIFYKESDESRWNTPSKIGSMFLNRFVIDEDFACEILGIYELSNNDMNNFAVVHNSLAQAGAYRGYLDNIHCVFARNYLSLGEAIENMIVHWMKKYGMKESVIVTLLTMKRLTLVTKERMMVTIRNHGAIEFGHEESTFDGDLLAITGPGTVDDDLERFVVKLKMGQRQEEEVRTFQFPKLTERELHLWESQEPEFLSSLQVPPQVSLGMEFLRVSCSRLTMFKVSDVVSQQIVTRRQVNYTLEVHQDSDRIGQNRTEDRTQTQSTTGSNNASSRSNWCHLF